MSQLEPGQLAGNPSTDNPERLTLTEQRLVARMVAGLTWQQALDAEAIEPRARIRDSAPREAIRTACERVLSEFASKCAASQDWILRETLLLYRRAVQAEQVLDRKGKPTGLYRFDGATARGCLEMLGNQQGMFRQKGGSIAVSDVAQLLAAVADRGKPALPGDRARLIGSGTADPSPRTEKP